MYQGVSSWTKRSLQRAGERVMDVPLPDDADEEDEKEETPKLMSDVNSNPQSSPQPSPESSPGLSQTAQESATTSSSFVSDRTTLSCRAPINDTSISQCAKNDPDPS